MNAVEHAPSGNTVFVGNSKVGAGHELRCSTSPEMPQTPTNKPDSTPAPATPVQQDASSAASFASASFGSEDAEVQEFCSMDEFSIDPDSHDVLVRVLSPLVPRLVGKSGAGIKEVQSLSGASLTLSKERGTHCARISGTYPETHLCAVFVAQKITPREETVKHTRLAALATYFRSRCQKSYVEEQFVVPVEYLGYIIGKGGVTLREIQEQSNAKIEIPRQSVPSEFARVMNISGSREAVQTCIGLLRMRMQARDEYVEHSVPYTEMYGQDARQYDGNFGSAPPYAGGYPVLYGGPVGPHYPPQQYDNQYAYPGPHGYPGYPAPYGFVPMVPVPFGYSDQLSADMSRVSLSPSLDSQDGDHQVPLAGAPPSPHLHPGALPFVPSPGSSPRHGFYSPMSMRSPMAMRHAVPMMHAPVSMSHEIVMAVPAELIGRLIGRQGVAVKQLQAETKSRVDVIDADASTPNGTRYVRITALRPEHLQACQSQINARIAAHFGTL